MFLALTADQRFWDTSQEILFLGEWCKLYSQKEEWSKLKYKTLPDVRETITDPYEKQEYADKLYEKYISLLSVELNKLHGVNYSEKYWRIVVGPWLRAFIQSLFQKYLIIKFAETEGTVTDTIIPICNPDMITPSDTETFSNWSVWSDIYNQYLFGRIIKERSSFPYHEKLIELPLIQYIDSKPIFVGAKNSTCIRHKVINNLFLMYTLYLPLKINSIIIINSLLSSADVIKLCLKLRQFPHFLNKIPYKYDINPISESMRRKIVLPQSESDEFDKILSVLIPEQIPKGVIEDFEKISNSINKLKGKVKVIYCATGIFTLGQSILAANISENGGKLIETQHGGTFGSSEYFVFEPVQIEQSDLFLSWGWSDHSQNVMPMSTGSKLPPAKKIYVEYNNKGKILLLENGLPRYNTWNILLSFQDGPLFKKYISEQYDFCSSLSQDAISLLNIRPYYMEFGWDTRQRWADKFPNISTTSGEKNFYDDLKESRLLITCTNSVTFLECFISNIPTILFWNPEHVKLRPSAQPYFDKLHEVGILHYTPQSAAKLVNEICDDPMKWWMQPEIQQAKDEFCYQFARTSDDWMDQLAAVLKSQLALAKKEMKARRKK